LAALGPPGETDAGILGAAAEGDRRAWDSLLERHGGFVLRLARERLRRAGFGQGEAEEVAQEVWTALLGNVSRIRLQGEDLRPYLAAAVLNAARMWLRSGARRAAREVFRPVLPPPPEAPEDALLGAERRQEVEEAIARLDEEDQLLLRWIYWGGLTYPQAAKLLGISVNAMGVRLMRARKKLRTEFDKNR
jgi:RNA polymerase sigma-70 factor (ECF subfamily)